MPAQSGSHVARALVGACAAGLALVASIAIQPSVQAMEILAAACDAQREPWEVQAERRVWLLVDGETVAVMRCPYQGGAPACVRDDAREYREMRLQRLEGGWYWFRSAREDEFGYIFGINFDRAAFIDRRPQGRVTGTCRVWARHAVERLAARALARAD